ncbi:hypothetical protein [Parabacteroides sp. AF17-3]|uniref:hypothetical protein n=1 Tax=Parabacteroides sp. AF17-3 TaxID=2293113 RepID=UPI0018F71B20|nr:hypothetical protein [Parabacteroides sp. AF17-3]
MNLIDAFVNKVLSGVYEQYGKFWVKVSYTDMGGSGETTLMFDNPSEAIDVKEGYKFQH